MTMNIFCEDDCHIGIINSVIKDTTLSPRIIKTGGVRGQNAFVDGFIERKGVSQSPINIVFRDRDFDFPIPDSPQLIIDNRENKSICTSYRVTAENYLLSPKNLKKYLEFYKIQPFDIESLLIDSAKEIAYYSAVRHALAFFRDNYSFRTSWRSSGSLPANEILQNRVDLTEKGWELISQKQSKLCIITKEVFTNKLEEFYSKFTDDFYANEQYLVWFNGKDLFSSLNKQLQGSVNITQDSFYKLSIRHFDYQEFADLVEFKNHLLSFQ